MRNKIQRLLVKFRLMSDTGYRKYTNDTHTYTHTYTHLHTHTHIHHHTKIQYTQTNLYICMFVRICILCIYTFNTINFAVVRHSRSVFIFCVWSLGSRRTFFNGERIGIFVFVAFCISVLSRFRLDS